LLVGSWLSSSSSSTSSTISFSFTSGRGSSDHPVGLARLALVGAGRCTPSRLVFFSFAFQVGHQQAQLAHRRAELHLLSGTGTGSSRSRCLQLGQAVQGFFSSWLHGVRAR
jgi:hypothetical protein